MQSSKKKTYTSGGSDPEKATAVAQEVVNLFNCLRVQPPDGMVALYMVMGSAAEVAILEAPSVKDREFNKAQMVGLVEKLLERMKAVPTDDEHCTAASEEIDALRAVDATRKAAEARLLKAPKEEVYH